MDTDTDREKMIAGSGRKARTRAAKAKAAMAAGVCCLMLFAPTDAAAQPGMQASASSLPMNHFSFANVVQTRTLFTPIHF
jgi:hypothetical protein